MHEQSVLSPTETLIQTVAYPVASEAISLQLSPSLIISVTRLPLRIAHILESFQQILPFTVDSEQREKKRESMFKWVLSAGPGLLKTTSTDHRKEKIVKEKSGMGKKSYLCLF
ncbi:hypothetical protein CHARACLAT_032871 [Characodon lateralis]|uniref:Uncharacterized protein n=1 Tax=Characodon lateralis TaxID=208331 RepID=A0ABU7D6U2_9TELE|nr:hypothetical protein [Characodon lateralis]